jgi:hypothetical protein
VIFAASFGIFVNRRGVVVSGTVGRFTGAVAYLGGMFALGTI